MPCAGQHACDLEVGVCSAHEVESVDLRGKNKPKQQKHLLMDRPSVVLMD